MNIIVSALMQRGTFVAKFIPLSKIEYIEKIYIVRKTVGPKINKVEYIVLPKICKINLFYWLITPVYLIWFSKKYNCQIILSYHFLPHTIFSYIASLITKIPFNYSQTGGLIHQLSKKRYIKIMIKYILNRALFINTPGEQSKKLWLDFGLPEKKINLLHSTVDTEYYKPALVDEEFDFIFVGRLFYYKRVDMILKCVHEIVKIVPSLNCVIVGDGPEKSKLINLANTYGISTNVKFVGKQNAVKHWLLKSKIFVMTSETEGLPTALMEAMSCERLVVVPNVGNIASLVTDGSNGFLVNNNNDFNAFYTKLYKAYNEYAQLYFLRQNARKSIIENHSFINAQEKWEAIFRGYEIVNEKN